MYLKEFSKHQNICCDDANEEENEGDGMFATGEALC